MERSGDQSYFRLREVDSSTIQVLLDKSLEDLVDRDTPQNLLKFKIMCSSANSRNEEQVSFMTITVYIEDINDHFPAFLNLPYEVEVDELIPVGSTLFQNIVAFDRDKPNTPNSDIQYSLGATDSVSAGYFALESPHRPSLVLRKALDFDDGIKKFDLQIIASVSGSLFLIERKHVRFSACPQFFYVYCLADDNKFPPLFLGSWNSCTFLKHHNESDRQGQR